MLGGLGSAHLLGLSSSSSFLSIPDLVRQRGRSALGCSPKREHLRNMGRGLTTQGFLNPGCMTESPGRHTQSEFSSRSGLKLWHQYLKHCPEIHMWSQPWEGLMYTSLEKLGTDPWGRDKNVRHWHRRQNTNFASN